MKAIVKKLAVMFCQALVREATSPKAVKLERALLRAAAAYVAVKLGLKIEGLAE